MNHKIQLGNTVLNTGPNPAAGQYIKLNGIPFYRISNVDSMPPFLMSLVSDSDHWMFISSNGALTAGRKNADNALFPYYTDDRIHDSADQTGSKTVILATRADKTLLWEPFSTSGVDCYRIQRNLQPGCCREHHPRGNCGRP